MSEISVPNSVVPTPGPVPTRCPRCGGGLSEPVSGDVHCYVECTVCAARFELDDPELAGSRPA